MNHRYSIDHLIKFGAALFHSAGMPQNRSQLVAKLLVDADRMGHDTHGMNLAAQYLDQLDKGQMLADGEPTIVNQRAACETWDGHYLNGLWLTHQAVQTAIAKARECGIGSVCIRRSHHIGCLATFLPYATDQGLMVMIASSDPSVTGVTPHGGVEGCFTPNPVAFGYPTQSEPVLIDISASITTLGMSGRLRSQGEVLPGPWLVAADGNATSDPQVLVDEPPGALLPLGGLDAGHKGYALALMVEALTSGLAGFGRADTPTNHGASVFVQVFDPDAFGGAAALQRETEYLAERCREARTAPGQPRVRLPGERAQQRLVDSQNDGVELYPGILDALSGWADRFDVALPEPLRK